MIVAGGESVARWNPEHSCQFGERRPFVVIAVGETQVDRVSLVAQFRQLLAVLVEERTDATHLWFVMGDDAGGLLLALDELRCGVELQIVAHAAEEALVAAEQFYVGAFAALVPVTEVDPAVVFVLVIDLALFGDHVIGVRVNDMVGDPSDGLKKAAPGVDRPSSIAGFLEGCDTLEQFR